jgi:hypothetical protein
MIAICPRCNYPTLLLTSPPSQVPAPLFGGQVTALPPDVERFYGEARRCGSVEAWAALALLCRTLLMHVAVEKGTAKIGDRFEPCVEGLDKAGWIPTGGREWVDEVRRVGNKAAHRADPVTREEAELIMHFVELLLRNVYEAPARFARSRPPAPDGSGAPPA